MVGSQTAWLDPPPLQGGGVPSALGTAPSWAPRRRCHSSFSPHRTPGGPLRADGGGSVPAFGAPISLERKSATKSVPKPPLGGSHSIARKKNRWGVRGWQTAGLALPCLLSLTSASARTGSRAPWPGDLPDLLLVGIRLHHHFICSVSRHPQVGPGPAPHIHEGASWMTKRLSTPCCHWQKLTLKKGKQCGQNHVNIGFETSNFVVIDQLGTLKETLRDTDHEVLARRRWRASGRPYSHSATL